MWIEIQPSTNNRSDRFGPNGILRMLYVVLLLPGVLVILQAMAAYPLLDSVPRFAFLLSGFLVPLVLHIILRNQLKSDGKALRSVYVCSGVVLVLLGVLLFANGSLDRFPASKVRTTVLEKTVIRGRYGGIRNHLFVASWRMPNGREDLSVLPGVYDRVAVGKMVSIELHNGFLGLSWYGSISPD